jgi:hypothetical protein
MIIGVLTASRQARQFDALAAQPRTNEHPDIRCGRLYAKAVEKTVEPAGAC